MSPQIQSSVIASRPITFDSAKELAQSLIDHRKPQITSIPTPVPQKTNPDYHKKGWNKRKRGAPQGSSNKQQLVVINAATVTPVVPANPLPAKTYAGSLPKCNKCNFHHRGPCREMQCTNCNRKGHTTRFCQAPTAQAAQVPNAGMGQTCYGCGEVGHYKRNYPKAGMDGGVGRVMALGHEEAVADPMIVTGTFLLNNSYA